MKLLIVLLLTCFSLIDGQNLNPCFGVTDDTFFPHPRTPSKFLACFDGVLQEGSCPPGMEFDRIELYCDLPQSSTRRPDNGNICAGVPNETFLVHPNSQRKYIICINGEMIESDCPNDFPIFNPNKLYCDYEVNVTTRPPPAPITRPPPPSTTRRPSPSTTRRPSPSTTRRPPAITTRRPPAITTAFPISRRPPAPTRQPNPIPTRLPRS